MSFTDIRNPRWIERLPSGVRPYVLLMRLDRPIGWWLLLLPSWWGILLASGGNITARTVFLMAIFWVGAILMRGAGCVINDLWDRDLDRKVARTAARPLASGAIKTEDAVIFLILLLLSGLGILILLPFSTILLGMLSLPLIVAYPLMKRLIWWPQAFLGLTFNFGILMGYTAVNGALDLSVLVMYVAAIFWTLGYDTVYAHQDKEDDKVAGIKSTALLFGTYSRPAVFGFYAAAYLLLVGAMMMAGAGWMSLLISLGAGLFGGYHLSRWDPENQPASLKMFRCNREIGLLIVLALCV
ncbi:MAG: 4-hydroxybenzoate octaprenyltransferase [Rhodospirillales bacterium]|nr:4-hydroxybenzoate octaprenyltransferase [Rhodospirillales bacterium]